MTIMIANTTKGIIFDTRDVVYVRVLAWFSEYTLDIFVNINVYSYQFL